MMRSWMVTPVGLVCLLIGSLVQAGEEGFPVLKGPYFGQKVPGLQAEPFAPGLISLPGRYEFALSFAPGGQRLLFTAQTPAEVVQVLHSRVTNGSWILPEPVSLAGGERRDEMEAFFARDGMHVYFAPYDEGLDVRIWQVEIDGDQWVEPAPLLEKLAKEGKSFGDLAK